LGEVQALVARLGLRDQVQLIPGHFTDTLPRTDTGPIAVLHLDCDWYDSVRVSLDHLYARVVPGGVIQIDDYGRWQGARRAVDEFLAERRTPVPLQRVDYNARRWIKPAAD
jgi:predicted O-methyltransferase YrrM